MGNDAKMTYKNALKTIKWCMDREMLVGLSGGLIQRAIAESSGIADPNNLAKFHEMLGRLNLIQLGEGGNWNITDYAKKKVAESNLPVTI